jgi:aspartate 4-decarboxylase
VVAVNQDNVFDETLTKLPAADRKALAERYSTLTLEPEKLTFIDRMVADSRDVALNHTAGLSLPQQIQMALFSLFALLDEHDVYQQNCRSIIDRRLHALVKGLGVPLPKNRYAAHYYVELDLMRYIETTQSKEFAAWMRANFEPVDPVFRLAERGSIVVMNGGGFDGPEWSLRISLANLPMAAYGKIGGWLREVMEGYLEEFTGSGGKPVGGTARDAKARNAKAATKTGAKTRNARTASKAGSKRSAEARG